MREMPEELERIIQRTAKKMKISEAHADDLISHGSKFFKYAISTAPLDLEQAMGARPFFTQAIEETFREGIRGRKFRDVFEGKRKKLMTRLEKKVKLRPAQLDEIEKAVKPYLEKIHLVGQQAKQTREKERRFEEKLRKYVKAGKRKPLRVPARVFKLAA